MVSLAALIHRENFIKFQNQHHPSILLDNLLKVHFSSVIFVLSMIIEDFPFIQYLHITNSFLIAKLVVTIKGQRQSALLSLKNVSNQFLTVKINQIMFFQYIHRLFSFAQWQFYNHYGSQPIKYFNKEQYRILVQDQLMEIKQSDCEYHN